MTGLLNKAASESEIGRLCADGSAGVLMMLDLDSFKLVNDIYGHDMGERNVDKGAYTLSFEKLGVIYRFFVRFSQAHPMHVLFVRFVIVPKGDGSSVLPADADSFFEHLTLSLGSSDIVSRNGDCEYLAILTGDKDTDRSALIEKIAAEWPQSKEYEISFEVEELK